MCIRDRQIDSTKSEVLEAALRVYNGKPIVNSVNGEDAVLDKILPVVAKYGAAVIGLTLDENGIPDSAEGRDVYKRQMICFQTVCLYTMEVQKIAWMIFCI